MVKREEVEKMLDLANDPTISSMGLMLVNPDTMAELCRTWLAVDSAPLEVLTLAGAIDGYAPPELALQRVKLVLVPEAGGGEE